MGTKSSTHSRPSNPHGFLYCSFSSSTLIVGNDSVLFPVSATSSPFSSSAFVCLIRHYLEARLSHREPASEEYLSFPVCQETRCYSDCLVFVPLNDVTFVYVFCFLIVSRWIVKFRPCLLENLTIVNFTSTLVNFKSTRQLINQRAG